jgi:hypothetical protein
MRAVGRQEGRLAARFCRKLNPAEQRLARRRREIGDDARKFPTLRRLAPSRATQLPVQGS